MSSPDKLTIETPEQTLLEFPLAGIGSRFLALAADTAIQALALLILVLGVELAAPATHLLRLSSIWVFAVLTLAGFVVYEGYFAIFEAVWNGQTPGKRIVRLRVMKDDGRPIGVYDAIVRNLLRIIDQMPGILYGVGIIVMLFSRQNKRLGDHVASTVVVREGELGEAPPFAQSLPQTDASFFDTSRLSVDEFRLIETFLGRRASLESEVRRSMALQIAGRIAGKLGLETAPWPACERFLETVFAQVRARGLR